MKKAAPFILFGLLAAAAYFVFPQLFAQVVIWQREFNRLLSAQLHEIRNAPLYAGGGLILISFLYGVFHALGPGHGKFIITGYLSTHQSKIAESMRLTFLSSLMQGVVAVTAVSFIVALLNLSSAYFKLSQLWLERIAFGLILLLGVQWCYQSIKKLYRRRKLSAAPKITALKAVTAEMDSAQSAVGFSPVLQYDRQAHCDCGHQHMPAQAELEKANDFRSRFLIILSIGMRPCTGAIFILFLSYMIDLYYWGIAATMAMSLGTAITLSAFVLLVLYARRTAVNLGKWYLSPKMKSQFAVVLKLLFGVLLIGFSVSLIYATMLPSSGGAVLFGR